MSNFQPCVVCGVEVIPSGTVHAECHKLLLAGFPIEAARIEFAKANLYAERMKPVLMKAANTTAINTVVYLFLASLVIGIAYAVLGGRH